MAPSTMKAFALGHRSWWEILFNGIRYRDISHGAQIKTVPTPKISPSEVLVKVRAVACNPTDWGHVDYVGPPNSIIGCDYCGIVEEVGSDATHDWQIGDRIAGVVHGGLFPDKGAFAQYLKVPSDLAWKPPANVSDQQAATYGISAVTAMQGLYTKLDVPWPVTDSSQPPSDKTILVYAGSTAASLYAIQLAKLSGYKVVTTCSPQNFDLVKSYGADDVYDYNSNSALEDIKSRYPKIDRAFDGISLSESTKFCASVVSGSGGKVIVLLDTVKAGKTPGVEIIHILMYTLLGEPFGFLQPIGPWFKAVPSDREALVKFYAMLPALCESIKPLPLRVVPGGYDGIFEALDLLRNKKVSGTKLIVDLM